MRTNRTDSLTLSMEVPIMHALSPCHTRRSASLTVWLLWLTAFVVSSPSALAHHDKGGHAGGGGGGDPGGDDGVEVAEAASHDVTVSGDISMETRRTGCSHQNHVVVRGPQIDLLDFLKVKVADCFYDKGLDRLLGGVLTIEQGRGKKPDRARILFTGPGMDGTNLSYLLEPPCVDAADVDDNGEVSIADATSLLSFLFLGGQTPPAPGPSTCGADPTEDPLDCHSFSGCQ